MVGNIAFFLDKVLQFLLKAGLSFLMLILALLPFLVLAMLLQVVTSHLRQKWFDLLGSRSWVLLALPGTVVHELGHWIFCKIFRHRVTSMKLFAPDKQGNLGFIRHGWDPRSAYQSAGNFFIGIGPVFSGTAVILLLTAWLTPDVFDCIHGAQIFNISDFLVATLTLPLEMFRALFQAEHWLQWQSWLWLISALLIGSHITLSRSDLQGVGAGAGTLLLIFFLASCLVLWADPARLLLHYAGSPLAVILGVLLFLLLFFTFSLIFAEFLVRLSKSGE